MSYDIQLWSVNELTEFNTKTTKNWQIECYGSDKVEDEDIPAYISSTLPGITYLTCLSLEPISAPKSARKELIVKAKKAAKATHGILFDPQTDEVIAVKGVKRFVPQPRSETFSMLEIGWWFIDDYIFDKNYLSNLLNIFAAKLPEALPRRYGLYEPPQHALADDGLNHLLSFLHTNINEEKFTVLYSHRPVLGLHIACTRQKHTERLGFKSNMITLSIEKSVLLQYGWEKAIRSFWLDICNFLNPFYSEVRTIDGYLKMGSTYGVGRETGIHPIRSWFWRGIPREPGHAMAIGKEYIKFFENFTSTNSMTNNMLVFDTQSWEKGINLQLDISESIMQCKAPRYKEFGGGMSIDWPEEYPSYWPFEFS